MSPFSSLAAVSSNRALRGRTPTAASSRCSADRSRHRRRPLLDAPDELKAERGVKGDTELTAEDLKGLVETFKGIVMNRP